MKTAPELLCRLEELAKASVNRLDVMEQRHRFRGILIQRPRQSGTILTEASPSDLSAGHLFDCLHQAVLGTVITRRLHLSWRLILRIHRLAVDNASEVDAGEWRTCRTKSNVTGREFAHPSIIKPQLRHLVDVVNRGKTTALDPIEEAAFVAWNLLFIHPFCDGNGRVARAVSYVVLCGRLGGWLPGDTILPAQLERCHAEWSAAVLHGHNTFGRFELDLRPLQTLFSRLLSEQIADARSPP